MRSNGSSLAYSNYLSCPKVLLVPLDSLSLFGVGIKGRNGCNQQGSH